MKVFRCRICGDPYLGSAKPSHCPFCGAPAKYIVLAREWREPEVGQLSQRSRQNLEKALELEVNNTHPFQIFLMAVVFLIPLALAFAFLKIGGRTLPTILWNFLKFSLSYFKISLDL